MTTAVQQLLDSFDALSDTEKQEAAAELLRRALARLTPSGGLPARVAGLHAGAIQPAADFNAPLPDDFWVGRT
jgi:hypothetical protein